MSPLRFIALWLARAAALAGLALAAVWSFRVAAADQCAQVFTVVSIGQAIAWTPDQSINYVRLSALVSDTDPTRAAQALRRAVALNPMDARSWVDLALRYETDGDPSQAERCLLRAADADHTYLPGWSLANFYFRQDDTQRFWLWARKAARMLYGDPAPLFRLAGAVDEDANLIERLNLRNPDLRADYLNYVLARDRVDLIHPVSQRLLIDGRKEDVPLLLAACDRLLDLQRVGEAIEVWNRLSGSKQIPYGPVNAPAAALTNGSFSSPVSSHGFDWRVPDIEGVSTANEDEPGGLRLTFSGRQPESCVPLSQLVPVIENAHYEVQYRYSTSGIADGSGLSWNLEFTDVRQAAVVTAQVPSDQRETTRTAPFDTPPGCHLIRLSLAYRRAPGTTRIEGRIVLRQVRLRRVG
jgi:tetratricopeptide (TPR) repeat protein